MTSPQSDRHLARSNSETRDHNSYENVHFQKNGKARNQSEPAFDEIHIPRVTPRKRVTDFKVGGQVSNYSNGPGTGCANKEDGPSSLGAEKSPGKKTTRRLNSRSVANIPSSSGSGLKTWQVSFQPSRLTHARASSREEFRTHLLFKLGQLFSMWECFKRDFHLMIIELRSIRPRSEVTVFRRFH